MKKLPISCTDEGCTKLRATCPPPSERYGLALTATHRTTTHYRVITQRTLTSSCQVTYRDVKRAQKLEAEAEAEARC